MLGSSTLTAFRHRFCITFDRLQRECQGCWNERKHCKSSLERWRLYPTQQLGSSVHLSGTIQLMEEIQRSPVEVGSLCIPLVYWVLYISGGDRRFLNHQKDDSSYCPGSGKWHQEGKLDIHSINKLRAGFDGLKWSFKFCCEAHITNPSSRKDRTNCQYEGSLGVRICRSIGWRAEKV